MTAVLERDTLELIQDTAKKSVEQKIVPMPNNPQEHIIFRNNGSTDILKTPFSARPRKHQVESIESFVEAYERWRADCDEQIEQITEQEPGLSEVKHDVREPNIWVDVPAWRLLFFVDEPVRQSWVKLKLTPSPQLLLMQTFASPKTFDQKTLVRMLRHDLFGCITGDILPAFRSVDFEKMVTARRQINHEKQTLDQDIVAQVSGPKKPEDFLVEFPLFAMQELKNERSRVRLTIDIDCDSQKFTLQALPGELDAALDDARQAVLNRLRVALAEKSIDNCCILLGTPGKNSDTE